MRSRRLILAAALASACALPAGSAQAADVTAASYDVAVSVSYDYHATEGMAGAFEAVRDQHLTWLASSAKSLWLTRATTTETAVAETNAPTTTLQATYHQTIYSHPITYQDCTWTQQGQPGTGIVGASTAADGTITVDLQPFDHVDGLATCTHPAADPSMALLGRDFSAQVTIPAEKLGDAEVTVPIQSPASQPCPSFALTITCDASWTGVVTLTRRQVATDGAPGIEIPPLVLPPRQPAPQPAPAPKPKPAPVQDDATGIEIPPLVDRATKVSYDARTGTLRFAAACRGGCAGTATLRVAGRRASAAKADGPVATVRFAVAADRARHAVTVRLPARARAALKRARRGTLTIALRDRASGRTTTVRKAVR